LFLKKGGGFILQVLSAFIERTFVGDLLQNHVHIFLKIRQKHGVPVDFKASVCYIASAGWSSSVARRAHNPKVRGPATNFVSERLQHHYHLWVIAGAFRVLYSPVSSFFSVAILKIPASPSNRSMDRHLRALFFSLLPRRSRRALSARSARIIAFIMPFKLICGGEI